VVVPSNPCFPLFLCSLLVNLHGRLFPSSLLAGACGLRMASTSIRPYAYVRTCVPAPHAVPVAWHHRSVPRWEPELQDVADVLPPPTGIRPSPPILTTGEHTSEIPSLSSSRSAPQPSPRPPPPLATGTARTPARSCPSWTQGRRR
jgi:hypothetical protein